MKRRFEDRKRIVVYCDAGELADLVERSHGNVSGYVRTLLFKTEETGKQSAGNRKEKRPRPVRDTPATNTRPGSAVIKTPADIPELPPSPTKPPHHPRCDCRQCLADAPPLPR
jgi:hypothetical protein